jgi:hypothetical protein
MAMAVRAPVPGQGDHQGDSQHKPFITHDPTREQKEIGQGCPG